MPYFTANDDSQLFYIDAGSGRPVVFVSSAWLSSKMWDFQMPFMCENGVRAIAYDRRGHGRSDWPWDGYDYDALADDLARLIEHLDLRDVTLVSHSAGSGEVIRYLTRHGSSRIARVAIISGTAPFPMKTPDNPVAIDRHLMDADLSMRTADRPKWFADNADGFFGTTLPGVKVSAPFVQFMIQQCLDCSARAASEVFVTAFSTDLRAEMQTMTVPTLIVHGDHDMQAPLEICGRRSAQLLPNAELVVYENAAHGLFVTHAERLNGDLLEWIERR